ncbi:MFS transporter [Streptomyces sp. NBC_00124]|uniref:MFS transporter n=1 Tax=Streptomyces sp. NBC_00124 TaxID=2975662 RepID=UPI002252808A|nr:MFS transporter [Streptomyces sp. NBC_00124]MCX5358125.1 MFS transporter [Streptomyces sp. NBC_00124]
MPSASANYLTLLRTSGAAAFFVPAAVGRLGIAMTAIGIVWLVHARTGSYAAAGLVTGAFAVADAVAGPQIGRLVDRFGQARVLCCALGAHAAAVALLLVGVVPDLVAGVLVGATLPQLGALSAARWSALLYGERAAALPTAFALEALANGVSYLAGPALVSVLGAAGRPGAGVLLAAALVVGGGLALAAQRRTTPPLTGRAERRHAQRALLGSAFLRQVALGLALGVFFGAMQVSVTAYAVGRGTPDVAAPLYFASNCTNLVGGWVYGAWRHGGSPRRHQTAAAAGLALVSLPLTILDAPLAIGVTLALTGLAVPVLLILTSALTQSSVPRAVLTQAFTWGNSASAAGSAASAAIAGRVVDTGGAHGGFGVAAGAAVAMTVLALGGLRDASAAEDERP